MHAWFHGRFEGECVSSAVVLLVSWGHKVGRHPQGTGGLFLEDQSIPSCSEGRAELDYHQLVGGSDPVENSPTSGGDMVKIFSRQWRLSDKTLPRHLS